MVADCATIMCLMVGDCPTMNVVPPIAKGTVIACTVRRHTCEERSSLALARHLCLRQVQAGQVCDDTCTCCKCR
jgi:hypothetical protein